MHYDVPTADAAAPWMRAAAACRSAELGSTADAAAPWMRAAAACRSAAFGLTADAAAPWMRAAAACRSAELGPTADAAAPWMRAAALSISPFGAGCPSVGLAERLLTFLAALCAIASEAGEVDLDLPAPPAALSSCP
eukprot:scaffold65733_cov60-Phaeocystis_antarctica.AAC.2